MASPSKPKPLGERLIDMGLLTRAQLELALKLQERTGEILGEILLSLGFISQDILSGVLAAQSNIAQIDLSKIFIEAEVLTLIPENLARKSKLIPVSLENDVLTVAMENVFDVDTISELEKRTGRMINVVASTESDIVGALDIYYSGGMTLDELIEESIGLASKGDVAREALVEEAPIVKLVNQIIIKGVKENATDVHLEPEEKILRIRYRIDGLMVLGPSIPKALQSPITARLKIISGANIAEVRIPQDGRIRFQLGRRTVDIRVSFFPVINGENVVLRLLDKSKVVVGLEKLGMSPGNIAVFKESIEKPFGMILVTGPTGSGKTTTLYSALSYLNALDKNIVTLEDPVEYEFPIIRQSQVNTKINYTFAEGLRSILRQDPDIILVGEMRDKETIDMSIRSALTGHLVLSTIHTNNSITTISRLVDMGAEPFLISSTLILVIAQRLVRRICPHCRVPVEPGGVTGDFTSETLTKNESFFMGKGCAKCRNTGILGRMGVHEVLHVTNPIRDMIEKRASTQEIAAQAQREGFKSLFEDALEKAQAGQITLDEAVRVTMGVF